MSVLKDEMHKKLNVIILNRVERSTQYINSVKPE